MLRNVQQQVALKDPAAGIVVTQDLGDDGDIHPRRKFAVAGRAVQVARALRGGGGAADGIVPRVVTAGADNLTLEFAPPLAVSAGAQPVAGFSLCQPQVGSCKAARATQRGSHVEIDRAVLPAATRLRYCWSDGGVCELQSLAGLPVSSFELPLHAAGK
jgi:sialate O-acetylesterase